MRTYSASNARAHLSDLLDAAERGERVSIERRDTVFELKARRRRAAVLPDGPVLFEWDDPSIERGDWTWDSGPSGLAFRARRSKKR